MSKYRYLDLDDRKQIAAWYGSGERACDIAKRLGVHTSTIYTELHRGETGALDENQRPAYDPIIAQRVAQASIRQRGRRAEPKAG